MGAFDDIMSDGGYKSMAKRPIQVTPTRIDSSMGGGMSPVFPGNGSSGGDAGAKHDNEPGHLGKIDGCFGPVKKEKPMTYVEMLEKMNPYKPETEEERIKREKKEKRQAAFAAIGDSISALSNLFFTTQYAPSSYDASKGMSARTKERWEKLRKEREENQRQYLDQYIRATAMDRADEKDERNWKHSLENEERNWRHTLEREKIADERYEAKEKREERKAEQNELMFQAKYALQMGKLTEQGYRNLIMEIKAGSIQELTDAQINRLNRMGAGGGNGKPGEYPWYDAEGNLHFAHSYEAMRQNAINAGTWEESTQTSTSVRTAPDKLGRGQTTTTTTRTSPGKGNSKKPAKTSSSASSQTGSEAPANGGDSKWKNTSNIKW